MEHDLESRIIAFLDEHHVMSLATFGSAGVHAANVFYARDVLSLLWVSDRDSRHSRELETRAEVAATIAAETVDFRTIRGVQIHGTARRLGDAAARSQAEAMLAKRFPFLAQMADAPPALQEAYRKAEVYRLSPYEIVMIDNNRGFGHKETLEL
jgi:uncharacterized protein YhbP (UPF0306 family)